MRELVAHRLASGPIIAEHLKSLMEYPPSQGADTLSIKKALEEMRVKMERAAAGGAAK